ncbi:Disease resistance protein [Citrus sinensis]|uniref:Disease resistance protein n=1 Tax=Citrus sinensis TaxID=2711 RepID=A0ACB8KE60_CITSI|nr:Disease resistance protein [Citrus sinensis]
MLEIIVTLVLELVKCLAPPTERQLVYLRKRNYDANLENLKAEMEKLKVERTSIQRRVSEAKEKGEEIEEKVEKWLVSANGIIDRAAKFIEDEESTNKRCLKGLCPNLKTRYQLSKKAETEVKALVELGEEVKKFEIVSHRTIPEEIWLKSNKGYEAFESRVSTLKSIQNALTDVNVSIIGVYGMGGIGKTTLVKEFARQAREKKLFDRVVFSEVSQTPDIKKIQGEIAEKLGLELSNEAEYRRASRLYERLKNENKILVILDNIWKHLDLETIGIPFGNDHKGCRLLLTARDNNVLLSMGSKDNFLIGNLNEEEAWRLFKIMIGDDVDNCKFKSIAINVAQACGGLPIALTTVARALRNKSLHEWKNALRELQTPSMVNFEGVPAETYSSIELSFKYLKGEQLKKIFLLCSLIGNSFWFRDLFRYSMGLGIFQGVNRMVDARNKLYALLHELRDCCLLLEGDSIEQFSMHDVVCDVAISIACREQHVFSVRSEVVWEWPDEDALKKCYAISLLYSSIHEVSEELECPQLEFLLIHPKDSFVEVNIPDNFFKGMKKLRVVDLTGMRLFSLPSSIGLLANLQTLCLETSMLGDIAIIGKLKNLEILSFISSDIVRLPDELGQLTKLRLLDLTGCLQLKFIVPNILSSFTRLEELYMANCSIEWEVKKANSERSNASLDELMHLRRLTTLEIDVKNGSILSDGFFSKKLERFDISIGDGSFDSINVIGKDWFQSRPHFMISNHESLRTLKLKLDSMAIFSKKLQGINNVEYLCLDRLQGIKNVVLELDTEGFPQLKHLHVQNNPDFLCIVDSIERESCVAFPLLESLTLHNLINMERICIDRLKIESFNELKTIKVENCYELSNIFWLSSSTKCLPRLERIAVINCSSMEEIFATGGEADVDVDEKIEFGQLRSLTLGKLPKVTRFCREVKTPSTSPNRQESQEELTASSNEISSDTSTLLFNEKVVLPNLEALELNAINVDEIWHYNQLPGMVPCFQSLTRLIVWGCDKLKYIFSASTIQSLEQLQHLEIRLCKSLQEIISEDRTDQVTAYFVFPRVTTLKLDGLPELRCLYPGMHTSEWPALKNLVACNCDKITLSQNDENDQFGVPAQQPLLSFKKILPNLKGLALSGKDITMILQDDFPQHLFGSLKLLRVGDDDLACFPLFLLERFHNLELLFLSDCSYEVVFSNEGYLEARARKLALIKRLHLTRLNHLQQLWKHDYKQLDFIFQHLQILRAFHCQNLLSLLPSSSVSFWNLTRLEAFACKKLMNLVTSSTAKSLERLVSLRVFGCPAMTEVVISDEDETPNLKEEIVFSKLSALSLFDLDSLTSFSSGNYAFKLPSLEDLWVIGCPKMKIFTKGELSTPLRLNVRYGTSDDKLRWSNNDLNTIIQQLHQEKLLEGSSRYSSQY